MKRKTLPLFILSLLFLVGTSVNFAQEENNEEKIKKEKKVIKIEKFEDDMEQWGEEMEQWGEELEESLESGIRPIPAIPRLPGDDFYEGSEKQTPKLGVYIDDLDFEEAYEMHYDNCYGVLVSGVVSGGNADKAGLTKGDIIMEFDGDKVLFEERLLSLRDSKNIGDTVHIKYFRNEKIMETELTFAPYKKKDEGYYDVGAKIHKKKKDRLSPGYGGGFVEAIWIDYDFDDFNNFIHQYDIDELHKFSDIGDALFVGGGGMGNVGKGWFIGGMGAGFLADDKISGEIEHDILNSDGSIDTEMRDVVRTLKIESGFGGVTIFKRIPLFTEKVVMGFGTMIGGGHTDLEIAQTNGDYSWSQDISDLNDGLKWYAKYEKKYFTLYSKAELLVRIKSWLGIRGTAGYLYSYSFNDNWKEQPFENTVSGDAPDIINGPSGSISIWFGF